MRLILLALLLASPALAGDPCPIGLEFYEFTPEWRDRTADLAALKSQRSWLGLTYRGESTVRVKRTVPGSPAAAALKEGDVLRAFNGEAIQGRTHLNSLFDAGPGAVKLTVEREGATLDVSLEPGPADPLFLGLVNAAETTECRHVSVLALTPDQQAAVAKGAFNEQRGFLCDSAHKGLGEGFDSGDVVMIRGGRRVLLTMPGWGTTCVAVADYDGDGLSADRLRALIEGLSAGYVADRHANP